MTTPAQGAPPSMQSIRRALNQLVRQGKLTKTVTKDGVDAWVETKAQRHARLKKGGSQCLTPKH